jgi:hypothetical protein
MSPSSVFNQGATAGVVGREEELGFSDSRFGKKRRDLGL